MSEETVLNYHSDAKILITESKFNPGVFLFSFSFIDFEIETVPFNWVVRRKEADFIKLREYYVAYFPQYVIPPLVIPEKSSNLDVPGAEAVTFQMFLDGLMSNEEFKACNYLITFLKEPDEKRFKNYRSEMEEKSKPSNLGELSTISGTCDVSDPVHQLLFIKEQKKHFIDPFDETIRNLRMAQIEIA